MANEKFYFIFSEQPNEKVYIDEPIDYRNVDFNLDRKENGMGLDVSVSGGEVKLRFTDRRNHYLEKLLYYSHKYGFEADVKLGIVFENGEEFISELDFEGAETNDFNYFECSTIVDGALQVFKRRTETKVDLYANTTIDGEVIEPLKPVNFLLKDKPTIQKSEWEQSSDFYERLVADGRASISNYYQVNPIANLLQSDINDSYTFFQPFTNNGRNLPTDSNFSLLKATTNLSNVILDIKDIYLQINTDTDNGGDGYVNVQFIIYKGLDFATAKKTKLFEIQKSEHQSYNTTLNFTNYSIGEVKKLEQVWIQFDVHVRMSRTVDVGYNRTFEAFTTIKNGSIKVSATSSTYNTVLPAFRLIDVMKQIAKSTANLPVYAPRYNVGGEFYDTFLVSGNGLRNKETSFSISWDDIEKSINPEHHADSEFSLNKEVFVGIEKDFYTGYEAGFFDNTQFSGLIKKINPVFAINSFSMKSEKYQSLKETIEGNSGLTIHGETKLTLFNKKVENKKELSIKWVRDSIMIAVQQRASLEVSKDTTTQDDDTIFAFDAIGLEEDKRFSESQTLYHTEINGNLSLKNDGSINFTLLGIYQNSTFEIIEDTNASVYTVLSILPNKLILKKNIGLVSSSNNGERLTKFIYTISKLNVPYTNRTNEGFATITNLEFPERYSNLRYSLQRNIRKYWDAYLTTANLYWKEKLIRNTYYKNNGDCILDDGILRTKEKEDFVPTTDPIFSPYMYEKIVFANVDFEDYIALQNSLRHTHGFIRTIDNNSRVLKIYPIKMNYEVESRSITIQGYEKFERTYMTIEKKNGIITINNETKLKSIIWELEDETKLILFDKQKERLYNGIYWDKVSVNGAIAPTINILKGWLDLL